MSKKSINIGINSKITTFCKYLKMQNLQPSPIQTKYSTFQSNNFTVFINSLLIIQCIIAFHNNCKENIKK